MKQEILSNLDNPQQLEKLYRMDKPAFKRAFQELNPELKERPLINFWEARLNFAKEEMFWGTKKDILILIIVSLTAALIAKLPAIFNINEELFYTRNIGFVIFPALAAYFAWKNELSPGRIGFIAIIMIAGLVFLNLLPDSPKSDTLILSCLHLIIILWSLLGVAFIGKQTHSLEKRLRFLTYNGDLIVMTSLILAAGAILSGVTIGLFSLIGLHIEKLYFSNVVIPGLSIAPILATYLTQNNPQLVNKISPLIARIFSPLVLAMLVVYLIAIFYSGKDPYNDREFLLIFNALLVGVMAIIFFSVAEQTKSVSNKAGVWILFLLSIITVIVNGIALSAIVFRISTWGVTPNRIAVLASNLLILINLLLVARQLFLVVRKKTEVTEVGIVIARYLPIYGLWAMIVTFLFPLFFGFK